MKSNDLRERELLHWFESAGSVLIGFSGGVDSTYLAAVALEALGTERTLAVIGRSASYPEAQWEAAIAAARQIGVTVEEVDTEELDDPGYAANPTNRCYFCKSELWSKLVPIARSRGLATVVDGTNADDVSDWRPGAAAAREHGVRSPLAELGFAKGTIRELSRARGLPTWSQPSSPCLASRLPYGTPVTVPRLRRVERAEAALRAIGIEGDLRVRDEGELARVELDPSVMDRWLSAPSSSRLREAVSSAGYARVSVDLRGFRSGSLNVLHGVVHS
jgi:pyridinium-3,5-biscarboxylic acid mononucleotide sulfurtransferase